MVTKTQLEESEVVRMMEEREKDGERSFFKYPFRATGHSTRPPAPSGGRTSEQAGFGQSISFSVARDQGIATSMST